MQRLRHRPRAPQRQLELLLAIRPLKAGAVPAWEVMPDRTRQVLIGLMTCLLVAHAGGAALASGGDIDER